MKLDILAFGVHPDDIELGCAGTLLAAMAEGKKVGIIDLTQGELGTRGTAETRKVEAENAAKILNVQIRENLKMADGFFKNVSNLRAALSQKFFNAWKVYIAIIIDAIRFSNDIKSRTVLTGNRTLRRRIL